MLSRLEAAIGYYQKKYLFTMLTSTDFFIILLLKKGYWNDMTWGDCVFNLAQENLNKISWWPWKIIRLARNVILVGDYWSEELIAYRMSVMLSNLAQADHKVTGWKVVIMRPEQLQNPVTYIKECQPSCKTRIEWNYKISSLELLSGMT